MSPSRGTTLIAFFVILGIAAFILLAVYCGGINHKIQRRRCDAIRHSGYGCSHATGIVFGYPLWFIMLPATFFYELAVGRAGAPFVVRPTRAQKRLLREQQKRALIIEQEKTLAAQKRVLELQLDINQLTDVATDGVFPRKTFEKS